jgi:hypothetical protein
MGRMRPFRLVALGLVLVALAACEGDGRGDGSGPSPSPLPSGSLGVVTQGAADEAVLGLCDLRDETDIAEANATFIDRSHQTLHVIAAAAEEVDRIASSALLEAKQRVEADLGQGALPPGFAVDVRFLLQAVRAAIDVIGLEPAGCAS